MSERPPQQTAKSKRIKRPTIYDVVKLSGFSRGSVSRAFNNSPFINAATRARIMEVAREIGYQPHAGARLIRSGVTRRWGILLPSFSNPYYSMLFEAFDIEARCRGTFLQLGLFHYDPTVIEVLVGLWSAGEVDGFIADSGVGAPELMEKVVERGIPVLFIHSRPSPAFDQLCFDRALSARYALDTFQRFGHKKIGYVGILRASSDGHPISYSAWRDSGGINGDPGSDPVAYTTWREWFEKHGEGNWEDYCCFVSNSGDGGVEAWHSFSSRGIRPTAVMAYNDCIACGLIQSAKQAGLDVPRDLSVVGNDDIEEGRRLGLSTMRPDLRSAAAMAVKQLEARQQGDTSPPVTLRVESQFIMRDSIAVAPQ